MKHLMVAATLMLLAVASANPADSRWMDTNNLEFQYQVGNEHGIMLRNVSNKGIQVEWAIWFTPNPEPGHQYLPAETKIQIGYSSCSETGNRKCIDRVEVHRAPSRNDP